MKRALAILLLAAGTAFGQIDNPPSSVNIVDATATGRAVLTATNAAAARNAVGLGATNNVTFNIVSTIQLEDSGQAKIDVDDMFLVNTNAAGNAAFDWGGPTLAAGLPISFSDATNAAITRTNLGLGATNNVTFNELTVKSLTTTDPVGWALDAVQTAAATNGVLTLPDAANVLRITNANAISGVTNGRLGAFYYLINQTTNNLTISNVGGITVQGGTPLTLGANQAATLVATGPTNASVAARGDLTDVTLGGTGNTAPNQTAASGASLMTRDLGDARYGGASLFSKLSSSVSYTNDTTGSAILSVELSNGAWCVEQFVRFTASATNSKISIAHSGPIGDARWSGYRGTFNQGQSSARVSGIAAASNAGGPWGDTVNTDNHERLGVMIVTNGPITVTVTAAQNATNATPTTVGSGSYLRARRIAADTAW